MSTNRKTITLPIGGKDRRVKIESIIAFGISGPNSVHPGERIDTEDTATIWTPDENLKVDAPSSEITKRLNDAGAGTDFFPADSTRTTDGVWSLNRNRVSTIKDISMKPRRGKSTLLIDCTPPGGEDEGEWEFIVESTAKAFAKKHPWSAKLFIKGNFS